MKILAIDTSSENCSLALWRDGELLSRGRLAGQRHTELILPMLEELLDEAAVSLAMLDGIAFGAGPGSFTGLRIACGVAQGLALGANLPLAAISTLEALAEAAGRERVIACLDARMGEIYHAAYQKRGAEWHAVNAPSLCAARDAPEVEGGGWFGIGSGFAAYAAELQQRYAGKIDEMNAAAVPQARDIARLAVAVFQQGRGLDAAGAAPLYIRDKVALKVGER